MSCPRQALGARIADFERRYPHLTGAAQRWRDAWRGLGGVWAALRGSAAWNDWKQRRSRAQRAHRRELVGMWLARRPL